jgi:predicted GNAT family acetyltransferase
MNLLAKKTSFFGGTESKWLEANNSNAADIPRCFLLRSKFSDTADLSRYVACDTPWNCESPRSRMQLRLSRSIMLQHSNQHESGSSTTRLNRPRVTSPSSTANVVAYAVLNYKFYDNGWIEMLYVHPQFRRQGIGSALIRHLINECFTPKLFTSTNQSNVSMQQLLATLEFDRSGFIENLDEGDPELVYFKRLRDNDT